MYILLEPGVAYSCFIPKKDSTFFPTSFTAPSLCGSWNAPIDLPYILLEPTRVLKSPSTIYCSLDDILSKIFWFYSTLLAASWSIAGYHMQFCLSLNFLPMANDATTNLELQAVYSLPPAFHVSRAIQGYSFSSLFWLPCKWCWPAGSKHHTLINLSIHSVANHLDKPSGAIEQRSGLVRILILVWHAIALFTSLVHTCRFTPGHHFEGLNFDWAAYKSMIHVPVNMITVLTLIIRTAKNSRCLVLNRK